MGITLLFTGVMGLVQALIILPFAQYGVDVGSLYVLILVPIVCTIMLTYSAQILYESYAQAPKKRTTRARKWQDKIRSFLQRELIRPSVIVIISFLLLFFIFYGIFSGLKSVNSFLIAENIGAIGALIFAIVLEKRIVPPERFK